MIEEIIKFKPKSIHDLIPSEFFTKYDNWDYVHSKNCFEWYYAISKAIQPKTFMEIGVRFGFSFLPTLLGSDSLEYALGWDLETYGDNKIANENIKKYYTGNCNWEIQNVDSQIQKTLPRFFDLISIDGCHDYSCKIHDLELAMNNSRYVIVDDYDYHPDVRSSTDKFIMNNIHKIEWYTYIPTFRGSLLIKFKENIETEGNLGSISYIKETTNNKIEQIFNLPKVSCVMCTYRRFTVLHRTIAAFLAQDYEGEKELIIYNTDEEYPLELDDTLKNKNIKIINNNIDQQTHSPYTNIGAIRRDSLNYATGKYYICWDDDDIFLPWNIRQGIDYIVETGKKSFKPIKSFFATQSEISLAQNNMEASIVVEIDEVRNNFDMTTGSEHLKWYDKLKKSGDLDENNKNSIPAYCFNWSDPSEISGHRQSGSIDNPNNFINHKNETKDYAKQALTLIDILPTYKKYYNYFINNKHLFNEKYYNKYFKPYHNDMVCESYNLQ